MAEIPEFRKYDRYKAGSYRSYNFKMPERYDTCFWMKFCQIPLWDQTIVQELSPIIPTHRIVDVGCATGRLLECLARAGAKDLFGIDLAPRILEKARKRMSYLGVSAELWTADAEDRLPWNDDFFDAATLTGVLHHFFRPRDAISEIRRVLRPGGRLLVIDPCFFPPVRQVLNMVLCVVPHDGDYHFYSARRAEQLLVDLGFDVRRTRRIGLWAYLVHTMVPNDVTS